MAAKKPHLLRDCSADSQTRYAGVFGFGRIDDKKKTQNVKWLDVQDKRYAKSNVLDGEKYV